MTGASITRAQAAAIRPRIEDPTRLANGEIHPRYGDWLASPGAEHDPWLFVTFDLLVERLPRTADTKLDTTAVRAALGPRWNDIILGRHLGAKAPTWTKLADLLGLSLPEMMEHVERARAARAAKDDMLWSCRRLPYRLQSWEEVAALEPCPGCGHPWGEPESEDAATEFRVEHGDCQSGSTRFGGRREHCNRCCGSPPMNPEVLERVRQLLASHARSKAAEEEAARARERLSRDVPARVARREAEIAALERKLDALRRKQREDEHQLHASDPTHEN